MESNAHIFVRKSKEIEKIEKSQLEARRKNAHKNNINDGFIIIDCKEIKIVRKDFLEGKISIEVPKEMTEMTEEIKNIKYPSFDRPKYIYTNEENSLDFSIEYDETDYMMNDETAAVTENIKREIKRLYTSSQIKEEGMIDKEGKNIGYFSFVVPVIDGKLYTFMSFQELEGKMLFCSFNCSEKIKEDWNEVILQMIMSIKENVQKD